MPGNTLTLKTRSPYVNHSTVADFASGIGDNPDGSQDRTAPILFGQIALLCQAYDKHDELRAIGITCYEHRIRGAVLTQLYLYWAQRRMSATIAGLLGINTGILDGESYSQLAGDWHPPPRTTEPIVTNVVSTLQEKLPGFKDFYLGIKPRDMRLDLALIAELIAPKLPQPTEASGPAVPVKTPIKDPGGPVRH